MIKVFIDTNVIIEMIMKREDYLTAARVFSCAERKGFTMHTSVLTMANIVYILRKAVGIQSLYTELEYYDELLNVESLTKEDYKRAISLQAKDFEDALQYECAISNKCDVIVTRNKKDFSFEGIQVMTPSQFLENFEG